MQLNFSWINILILFGAIQGLIFSVILFLNKRHPGAKFLSVFMFVFAYNGIETFNWSAGLDKYFLLLDIFPFVVIYAVGPSLYLYVTSLLYPDQKLSRKTVFAHFSIVAFQFLFRSIQVVVYLAWMRHTPEGENAFREIESFYWLYSEPLSILVFICYLIASIRQFRQSKISGNFNSAFSKEARQVTLKWLHALLTCMVILAICWPVTVIASYFTEEVGSAYYPIEVLLVLFIYWIAYTGYHKTMLIYPNQKTKQNALPIREAVSTFVALQKIMETEKMYLDADLNLNKVASRMEASPKTISTILNQYHQTNFNDFVNQYRVADIKVKLVEPKYQHMTISGIAMETGFNSQATFQRAFKNCTGISPRKFIDLHKKQPEAQTNA